MYAAILLRSPIIINIYVLITVRRIVLEGSKGEGWPDFGLLQSRTEIDLKMFCISKKLFFNTLIPFHPSTQNLFQNLNTITN